MKHQRSPGTRAILLALAAAWSLTAGAQTRLFRCGPDGRTYSQTPCSSGPATELKVPGEAKGTAQAEQLDSARREARLARSMEAERHRRERESRPGGAAVIPVHPVSVGPKDGEPDEPPRHRRKRHKDFTARVPKAAPTQSP